ncbi:hypothetical protein [Halomonas sp. SL1]|uniref:hypothetical protein n=1 Tax=Halomonas sp. SL1 TaxID=2137478 RepID=UPI0035CF4DB7
MASEDVVYLLDGLGIAHGVDLEKLAVSPRQNAEAPNRLTGSGLYSGAGLTTIRHRDADERG